MKLKIYVRFSRQMFNTKNENSHSNVHGVFCTRALICVLGVFVLILVRCLQWVFSILFYISNN